MNERVTMTWLQRSYKVKKRQIGIIKSSDLGCNIIVFTAPTTAPMVVYHVHQCEDVGQWCTMHFWNELDEVLSLLPGTD